MVAKISFPHRVLDALNYNEKKVEKGLAECLAAKGYLRKHQEMNFYQKLQGLENRNVLNNRAATKTIHVSLNFHPSEKLNNEMLEQIASEYMEKIGFGDQPFLVYKHNDAGHPHIHIVSTTIREDGTRIPTHNLGKNESQTARKELEAKFGLIQANGRQEHLTKTVQPLTGAVYGAMETKKSIAEVVNLVYNNYSFSSLPEFNAALRQFNVLADRGKEGGRIFRNDGLVYRILDQQGEKLGVPIKASSLPVKPTLKNLQKKFVAKEDKEVFKNAIIDKIDRCVATNPLTLQTLIQGLKQQGIYALPRKSQDGKIYGITFVDNHTKTVFNGSDLGKEYSAAGLQNRLSKSSSNLSQITSEKPLQPLAEQIVALDGSKKAKDPTISLPVVESLIKPQQGHETLPAGYIKKKRKKKIPGLPQ